MTINKERKSVPLKDDCVGAQKSGTLPTKLMVSVHDYWLDGKTFKGFFYVRSREIHRCPICGGKLKVAGSRKRRLIKYSGEKKILIIRRLRCTQCNRIHHELPDIIVPYKRYSSEAIENIILNKPKSVDASPCELSTVKRLKLWFFLLQKYYESVLNSIEILHNYDKEISHIVSWLVPFSDYQTHPPGWLKVLVRLVVNSNRWLHTRFA